MPRCWCSTSRPDFLVVHFFLPLRTFTMFANLQNPLALIGRLLLALLFLPAAIGKIGGFAGTVGYIGSKGLPMPELGAVIAIVVELGGSLALIAGFGTRFAALALALFTLAATFSSIISGLFPQSKS